MNIILENFLVAVASTFLGSAITNTKPGFVECLPKWNGSELEQPEHCKPVDNEKRNNLDHSKVDR
jgi:hypothetical protein